MVYIILIVLGLCLGSFTNAYTWRLHENNKKSQTKKLSIWKGRSICTSCNHILAWYDLIPIVSWLSLHGKCRYCKKPISSQYPLVELITAGLFIISYKYWPYKFNTEVKTLFIIWLIFVILFVILAIYDIKWRILPNSVVGPLIMLSVVQILIKLVFFNGGASLILGSLWGVLFSAGIFYAIYVISKGKWIGGGDIKLAIALGLLLGGPLTSILMIFLASLIGCFIALILLILKKMERNKTIAFGPLLIASTIISYIFGSSIIHWYKNLIF